LCPGGMLSFISSNKWFRANYGEKLRKYITNTCVIYSITDFGELPVFQNVATFPMIFIAQLTKSTFLNISPIFTQVKSLEPPYPDVKAIIHERGNILPSTAFNGVSWILGDAKSAGRLNQMESVGITLSEFVNGQIYWGIKTGLNEAFIIDGAKRAELIAKGIKGAEVIKPLAVGDNIRKWHIKNKDKWLLYMYHGIDISEITPILNHLRPYRKKLEQRATKQEWYELQQPQMRYTSAFLGPKIVYPIIAKESRFTFDTTSVFTNDKAFIIPSDNKYLLGVLNSKPVWDYLKSICSTLGDAEKGGRLELRAIYMSNVPIPDASASDRNAISALVQKCLDAKGIGCEEWEQEIDERVAALYGL
jgi:hypothetical protein